MTYINDEIKKQKSELRNFAKNVRNSSDIDNISENIVEKFVCFVKENFNKKIKIAIYYPFNSEINTTLLFKHTDLFEFYLPVVNNDKMQFFSYHIDDILMKNKYGIYEPQNRNNEEIYFAIMIVPALMADKSGYRLGYGGGFYDNFMDKYQNRTCIFIPDELIVDNLPKNSHDKKCDIIISEKRIIKID